MGVSVNVNKKSLCHKGSGGFVMATLPDVCKTPAPPAGPVPIPYPNFAFSKNLAKGTKKVKESGNSIAISPSEFSTSVGDEPGTVGGVISNVNKSKATWIMFSFNVFAEGKPVCRLGDKMLMNKGNTMSLSGEGQVPIIPDALMTELCEIACSCKKRKYKQNCMSAKLRKKYYEKETKKVKKRSGKNAGKTVTETSYKHPKDDAPVWTEVWMKKERPSGSGRWGKWGVIESANAPGKPTSYHRPVRTNFERNIRPDIVTTDGAGNPKGMIEVKFPNDSLNENQSPGGAYHKAAADMGLTYHSLDVKKCPCWSGSGKPKPPKGKKGKSGSKASSGVAKASRAQAKDVLVDEQSRAKQLGL